MTCKTVEVEEMTRLEYVQSRNWDLPDDEDPDEVVFKVFYKDGYVSMCHKDKFLEDATELPDGFGERDIDWKY